MCGIWCCISTGESCHSPEVLSSCPVCAPSTDTKELINRQKEFISRRGPDSLGFQCIALESSHPIRIHLEGYILWTQGDRPYQQPFGNPERSQLLLYNGDIYSFGQNNLSGDYSSHLMNDGRILCDLLDTCGDNPEAICHVLSCLQGPFAFLYLDKLSNCLWFARDFFGRESLLFSYENNDSDKGSRSWNFSSVSVFKNVFEVPASGLFSVNLETKILSRFPYAHIRKNVSEVEIKFINGLKSSGFVSGESECNGETKISMQFNPVLKLECKVKEPQDKVLLSLIREAEGDGKVTNEEFLKKSLSILSGSIDRFLEVLRKSVKRRVSTLPPYCKDCLLIFEEKRKSKGDIFSCNHSKVGVLFSGGVDSTVLAYLTAEALPEGSTLDLMNVAFSKDGDFSNIPDRETALESYKMLCEKFVSKKINLVLVNVCKPEVEEQRMSRIKHLIMPLKSVLDDSLGVCLWFAARGKGYLYRDETEMTENYSSPVRVVLLGSGADELLGGYGRHRSAYEKSGWIGLASEMQLEIDRISIRNLGRDNRIVSDHGICPRMPFLDEDVVDFLTSKCDLWVKCCPVNVGPLGSRGSGEKLLLRAVAATLFGDSYLSLALFPKRAMQFGSRIAKLENSKEKGGDSCQRLD